MYSYNCVINKIVDGDTVDINIDLGFGVWLYNERVRIVGIDAPESRSSDLVEKQFGLLSTKRLKEIFNNGSTVVLVSNQFKGKFGRILGDFLVDAVSVAETMLSEGYAVPYVDSKEERDVLHLQNRAKLINEGLIVINE